MALTTTQVNAITDSMAQAISDFNTCFPVNTAASTPSSSTIITGVSGVTLTNTLGRVLNYNDITPELNMLASASATAAAVAAYITGIQAISGFYAQFFPLFNALDLTTLGGLNTYLSTNSIQANARFAAAYNYWTAIATAVTPGRTSANAPVALSTANYFPYASVDTMWGFTSSAATTFSANAVGANVTNAASGGGVGQFYIYKVNAVNAVGSAVFTVTYTKFDGTSTTATYTTTSGVPLASGSLAAGYTITGAIGSAITAVTGSGMTSGEQYVIGSKIVRALSGY